MTFFVYGTLRGGHELLRDAVFLGAAIIRGRLYMVGDSYPGLVPARQEKEWVAGELYRIDSRETVRLLDAYEGCEYRRKRASVYRPSGERAAAWVYFYTKAVREERRIASGDFLHKNREN